MDTENPYAASSLPVESDFDGLLDDLLVGAQSCWNDRGMLVVRKDAQLPSRCVKWNVAVTGDDYRRFVLRFSRGLGWRTLELLIPLSPRWRLRCVIARVSCGLLVLLAAGMFFSGIGREAFSIALSGALVCLVASVFAIFASHGIDPAREYCGFYWISGVHRKFLAELPDWPAGRIP